jgi:hypothetical protein
MSRPINLLADKKVQSAKFEKLDKRTKLSDGAGLYLDIQQPSGKYRRMTYRFDGKETTLWTVLALYRPQKRGLNAKQYGEKLETW